MLFDAHAHCFTADTARYPVDVTGAREGEAAILRRIATDPLDEARLLALWRDSGVGGGAVVQYHSIYKTDNRYALDVGDRHCDTTGTVVMLRADDPKTPAALTAMCTAYNVTGLRLFGFPDEAGNYPWLDSDDALATWQAAEAARLAMVVMVAPGVVCAAALDRIAALARALPATPIAIDHCGWAGSADDDEGPLTAIASLPNVALKFTQINIDRWRARGVNPAAQVARLVGMVGAGRLLWGSDAGNTQVPYAELVQEARAATALLSPEDADRVLGANGRAMFLKPAR